MDLDKEFGTNAEKEVEGVWKAYDQTCEFRIARAGNPEFKKYHDRLLKSAQAGRREIPQELLDDVLNKAAARTIIKDWRGEVTLKGEPIPYSEGNALELLRTYKDFREFVLLASLQMKNYQDEEDAADQKNS